jgi:hypothetical protein
MIMTESKIIRTGPDPDDYIWDYKKTSLENWKEMKECCAKKGIDIGDFPVMTEEEKAEYAKLLENIK